jgi:beta-lactam-binding protein with PASTA domain
VRVRRHVPGAERREPSWPAQPADPILDSASGGGGRWWVRGALIVLATFGVGYAIATVWLSPVPFFSSDHAAPRLLDLPVAEAEARLAELGFRGRAGAARSHPTIAAGRVAWQDPPSGMVLAPNAVIAYAPSSGRASIPVPDVIGFNRLHAERVLAAAGLRTGSVDTVTADPDPDVVVATRPAPGTARDPGGTVDLMVSGRPRPGPVPIPALQVAPLGTGAPRP